MNDCFARLDPIPVSVQVIAPLPGISRQQGMNSSRLSIDSGPREDFVFSDDLWRGITQFLCTSVRLINEANKNCCHSHTLSITIISVTVSRVFSLRIEQTAMRGVRHA